MNTLTKSVILGFAIAGHSAAVATKEVQYKSYKIIGSSTCEAENMHTITDIDECSAAGAALGQGNYRQKDGSALGKGIYTTRGTGRTKGCTFHGGVIEETGGVYRYSSSIDVNDGGRGIQLFPLASGSCGSANFWCICGSEAPQHKKGEEEGHERGSGSGHGRGSHVKPPPPHHKKSEGEGHEHGSGSGHGHGHDDIVFVSISGTKDLSYAKTAGRAIFRDGSSGICSERLYYGSSGIKACEDKCDQCGDDCKGFVDNYQSSDPYCVFKSTTNIYEKETKDWYAKPEERAQNPLNSHASKQGQSEHTQNSDMSSSGSHNQHPEFGMDDSNFKMPQKREEGASEGVSAHTVALIGGAGFLAGIFSTFLAARCRSRRSNEVGPTVLSAVAAGAVTSITNPATPTKFTTIPAGTAAGTVAVADKV